MTHKFKITETDHPLFYNIELDGKDISKYVCGVSISLQAGSVANVTLDLVPMEIEIPHELEAIVIAESRESVTDDDAKDA